MPQMSATQVNDEQAVSLARTAIARFLDERPDFKDTKRHSVDDLLMYLEVEEDSAEWLPYFAGNNRLLSSLWHNLARNPINSNGNEQPKTNPDDLVLVPTETNQANKAKTKRVSRTETTLKVVEPAETIEDQPVKAATPVMNEPQQEIVQVSQEVELAQANSALPESALQTSRVVAEQFALVKYREQQLASANRTSGELNEALARAKQQQADAMQAYAHSLEELAQLLATSLGPKAGDFGKLFSRVVNAGGGK